MGIMNEVQTISSNALDSNQLILQEPLLGVNDDSNPDEKSKDQTQSRTSLLKRLTYSWSSLIIILAIGSIILTNLMIEDYFMLFFIAMGSYAVVQRMRIEGKRTTRHQINDLIQKKRELSEICVRLNESATKKQAVADKLEELEEILENTVKDGQSKEDLLNLVKDNKKINQQKNIRQMQKTLQDMFGFILDTDLNEDCKFTQNEIKVLEHRLPHFHGMEKFDKKEFEEVMSRSENSLFTLLYNVGSYFEREYGKLNENMIV